jgi:hypothetical protein
MIHKAKDLSPDQKMAIESLLGRAVAEDEAISIRTLAVAPEWLPQSWETVKRWGSTGSLSKRSMRKLKLRERHGGIVEDNQRRYFS